MATVKSRRDGVRVCLYHKYGSATNTSRVTTVEVWGPCEPGRSYRVAATPGNSTDAQPRCATTPASGRTPGYGIVHILLPPPEANLVARQNPAEWQRLQDAASAAQVSMAGARAALTDAETEAALFYAENARPEESSDELERRSALPFLASGVFLVPQPLGNTPPIGPPGPAARNAQRAPLVLAAFDRGPDAPRATAA